MAHSIPSALGGFISKRVDADETSFHPETALRRFSIARRRSYRIPVIRCQRHEHDEFVLNLVITRWQVLRRRRWCRKG